MKLRLGRKRSAKRMHAKVWIGQLARCVPLLCLLAASSHATPPTPCECAGELSFQRAMANDGVLFDDYYFWGSGFTQIWDDVEPVALDATPEEIRAACEMIAPFPPLAADGNITDPQVYGFESKAHGMYFPEFYQWKKQSPFVEDDDDVGPFEDVYRWGIPEERCLEMWEPGYVKNMDMKLFQTPGTYAPKSLITGLSTSPMVSRGVAHYRGPVARPEREMAGGNVDLITGGPLLEETDFQLDFGSALFRFNRTFSRSEWEGMHEYDMDRDECPHWRSGVQPNYWDWAGQGWMLGVQPILLIDSTNWSATHPHNVPRCYMIPDMHRAIPFVLEGYGSPLEDRDYVAPPHLDAHLAHNGDGTGEGWNQRPSEWYVWLQDSSIKYTFAPVYDDTGRIMVSKTTQTVTQDEHTPPGVNAPSTFGINNNYGDYTWDGVEQGYGTPHYAVVTRIDDRYGNSVQFEYCPFQRISADEPSTVGCAECAQLSQQKGQLRRIFLKTGVDPDVPGSGTTEWTIIPVYRGFGSGESPAGDGLHYQHIWYRYVSTFSDDGVPGPDLVDDRRIPNQHAVQSVYAYRGERQLPSDPDTGQPRLCLTIPNERFTDVFPTDWDFQVGPTPLDGYLAIDAIDGETEFGLPADWEHRSKYLYADGSSLFKRAAYDPNDVDLCSLTDDDYFYSSDGFGEWHNQYTRNLQSPRLLLVTTTARDDDSGQAVDSTDHSMLRYTANSSLRGTFSHARGDMWRLQARWDREAMSTLRARLADSGDAADNALATAWPFRLFLLEDDQTVLAGSDEVAETPVDNDIPLGIMPFATERFEPPYKDMIDRGKDFDNLRSSDFYEELLQQCVLPFVPHAGDQAASPGYVTSDVWAHFDRTGDGLKSRRIYRFVSVRDSLEGAATVEIDFACQGCGCWQDPELFIPCIRFQRSMSLFPFAITPRARGNVWSSVGFEYVPDLAEPMWFTIVDEFDKPFGAFNPNGDYRSNADRLSAGATGDLALVPDTRRLVIMNSHGFVLKERVWAVKTGELLSDEGLLIERIYDWDDSVSLPNGVEPIGRLMEVRSLGWSAASLAGTGDTEGLIDVYEYDLTQEDSMEVAASGVRRGVTGETHWTNQYIRDTEREDLVAYEIKYEQPATTLYAHDHVFAAADLQYPDPGEIITHRHYTLEESGLDDEDKRIVEECTVRPPRVSTLEGEVAFPIEITRNDRDLGSYDDTWSAMALLTDITGLLSGGAPSADAIRFHMKLQRSDGYGRGVLEVTDLDAVSSIPSRVLGEVGGGTNPPTIPSGWSRVAPVDLPPLNAWMRTTYSDYGPTEVENWNGRGVIHRYFEHEPHLTNGDVNPDYPQDLIPLPPVPPDDPSYDQHVRPVLETRTFENVEFDAATGDVLDLNGKGRLSFTEGEKEFAFKAGNFAGLSGIGDIATALANLTLEKTIRYEHSPSGAPTKISSTSADGEVQDVEMQYNAFGQLHRFRADNGTVTRKVHDQYGRMTKVYIGTTDEHAYWGTHPPDDPDGFDDNLLLTERHVYGDGPTDAFKAIEIRRYRTAVTNQYPQYDAFGEPIGPPSNEGSIGIVEDIGYDWRMREVFRRVTDSDGAVLRHTYTWHDNLGRKRFQLVYGANAPEGAWPQDPRALPADVASAGTPSPADLISAGAGPAASSITEWVYDAEDRVLEERMYVPDTLPAEYLTTSRRYSHAGDEIAVATPSGPAVHRLLDELQRAAVDSVRAEDVFVDGWSGDIELARTENRFDADNQVIEARVFERLHDAAITAAPGDVDRLDSSNAVVSRTFFWYNDDGKEIARAVLGASAADDTFANAAAPFTPARETIAAPAVVGGAVDRPGLPDHALVTITEYDDSQRIARVVEPGERVTTYEYQSDGKLQLEQRFADLSAVNPLLVTGFRYAGSKVEQIAVGPNTASLWDPLWGADGVTPVSRIARVEYAGPIVSEDNPTGAVISQNNAHVSRVYLNARPIDHDYDFDYDDTPDLSFTYFPDGKVATRTDARGVSLEYTYDGLGHVRHVAVSTSGADPPLAVAPDEIGSLELEHDTALGLLLRAVARTATGDPIAVNEFAYSTDHLQSLATEWQDFATDVVDASTPRVDYSWTLDTARNGLTLDSIEYPQRRTGQRHLYERTFGSGPDSIDGRAFRLTGLSESSIGELASFAYAGSDRRVVDQRGWFATDSHAFVRADVLGSATGYAGLDRFGRSKDLLFSTPDDAGPIIHRREYGYTDSGQIEFLRLTDREGGGVQENARSALYAYDGLDRLYTHEHGQLVDLGAGGLDIQPSPALPVPRLAVWLLDTFQNWHTHAIAEDVDNDGDADSRFINHNVNPDHEITSVRDVPADPGEASTLYFHDRAGNILFDGERVYTYDAWNRLVQINEAGDVTVQEGAGPDDRSIAGNPGDLISTFAYDGLGRLIRQHRPLSSGANDLRTDRYFYEGGRRIQDDTYQVRTIRVWVAADDHDVVAVKPHTQFAESPESPYAEITPGIIGGSWQWQTQTTHTTDREYVYGPAHVDEFVCQITSNGAPYYMIQDDAGSVTGLVNASGAVVAQYGYGAYGEVLHAEIFAGHPVNRVGHQGLFYDRLDVAPYQSQLAPGSDGLYRNRNRAYNPAIGRFMQRDPNASGRMLASIAYDGAPPNASLAAYVLDEQLGDGANLFAYLGSNPINHTDPTGLFFGGLPGLFAPTSTMDVYLDYNENAIDAGMSMKDYVEGELGSYGWDQLDAIEAIMDWDTPWGDHVSLSAGGLIVGVVGEAVDSHHVIPRFLMGIDDAANRLDLPKSKHKRYHKILREEFKRLGLNSPNARGDKRWVSRFLGEKGNPVSQDEIRNIRAAMLKAGRRFDAETGGEFRVAQRTLRGLRTSSHHRGFLNLARRRR